MLENNATTLWETWKFSNNTYSHNHPMFGSVSEWFYKWLAGIQPDADAVGFNKFIIKPQFPSDLEWVNADYNSVKGLIRSNWTKNDSIIKMNVIVPSNATATVYIPASDAKNVKESGKEVTNSDGIIFKEFKNEHAVYSIGSGEYFFESILESQIYN